MDVSKVVGKINKFAPKSLAGSWDNVGLLIEPTLPHVVNSILLTNDLTEVVMEEAINKKVNMIMSYHPPIFAPMKRYVTTHFVVNLIRLRENCTSSVSL